MPAAEPIALPTMRIARMRVADLKPAPYNPRRIAPAAIAGLTKSVERFGLVQPIIWNEASGLVVGGHQRLKVLRAKREREADVIVVNLTRIEERALNVALNSPAIAGEFTDALQGLLNEIEAADEILFADLRLGDLLAEIEGKPEMGEEADDAPALPAVAVTQPGDLWTLGRHRLICGDATDRAAVERIMGTERVDCLLTDPPYGVDYGAKTGGLNNLEGHRVRPARTSITGDTKRDYRAFFAAFLKVIPWAEYATFYIFMGNPELHHLREALDDAGLKWGDYLLWVKQKMVPSMHADYALQHEPILYGWPERHRFYGPNNAAGVLAYDRPLKADLHPTMKPVALLERLLRDGSMDGGIVLDCFGGSGSTLIACEGSHRSARLMEIEPAYCDVTVIRWQGLTGHRALRNGGADDGIP